ncbi:MAG: hypothetical protein KC549_03985, partial [Myxococcales bacterium]|nr:hypothetical protein [Myxococcales bacterium]
MRWMLGGAAALVLWTTDAGATAARVLQVPNGPVYNCALCHLSPRGAGPRTLFGEDVRATLRGTVVDWPTLCARDSDGDGYTNGEELGDPTCMWRRGGEVTGPPTNPNDPQDFPVIPPDAGAIEDAAVDAAPADAAPAPDAMAQRVDAG